MPSEIPCYSEINRPSATGQVIVQCFQFYFILYFIYIKKNVCFSLYIIFISKKKYFYFYFLIFFIIYTKKNRFIYIYIYIFFEKKIVFFNIKKKFEKKCFLFLFLFLIINYFI